MFYIDLDMAHQLVSPLHTSHLPFLSNLMRIGRNKNNVLVDPLEHFNFATPFFVRSLILSIMRKQLNVDLIEKELRGGSALFPGYEGDNSSLKRSKP